MFSMLRKLFFVLILFGVIFLSKGYAFPQKISIGHTNLKNYSLVNFDRYFEMAQNYYWLTLDEGIKSSVYFKTLKYIRLAKKALVNNYSYKDIQELRSLEKELNIYRKLQYEMAEGYFPMLKFILNSPFFVSGDYQHYVLLKNASVVAVENSVNSLIKTIKTRYQVDVFFNSKNNVWNEIALDKFNNFEGFHTHLPEEVQEILSPREIESFFKGKITKNMLKKFFKYTSRPTVYIIRIERTPLEKNDIYMTAYSYVYTKNGLDKSKSSIAFGYTINEKNKLPILIIIHVILLLIVLIIGLFKIRKSNLLSFLVVLIAGFVLGRIFPWIIIPGLEKLMPSLSISPLYALWWVVLVGLAIILAPIYGINLIYSKVQNYIKLPSIAGRGGIIGLSVSAGVLGYLFIPYSFTYYNVISPLQFYSSFALFSVAVLLSGHISGRILDKADKIEESFIIIFIIVSSLLFISFVHSDIKWINYSSVFGILVSVIVIGYFKIRSKNKNKLSNKELEVNPAFEHDDKRKGYYKFRYYEEILKKVKNK